MSALPLGVAGRRLLAAGLLVLVLAVVAWRHLSASATVPELKVRPVAVAAAGRTSSPSSSASPSRPAAVVVVDVAGAVRRPGLVRLPQGSRVADAIARAGGITRRAERTGVNLAAPVADGQQVLVPERGAVAGTASGGGTTAGTGSAGPVSLSAATAEQLDALPGIGPSTAQKIIAYRTQHGAFHSVDELDAISGIGPAKLADLQGLVVP
jgi:competence protein ComEA